MSDLKVGQIWSYLDSGEYYEVTGLSKMKIGETFTWDAGVTYMPLDPRYRDLRYTRDVRTFLLKFENVAEVGEI